ncbi:hypothetical protein SLS60_000597 [Paraconiothyrium brasiliense]|uniref:Uncharacterized protein n=1 Tax=Paraconiothyrium brasiliense TaxID=300254 RepID=A0ABR3S6N3_9PLEO
MASKLCCTVEQEGHPDSPELPNGRVTEAPTPARLPLLPKPVGSVNSHFTSARTEDLHELRQIFDNAKDNDPTRVSPTKAAGRARFKKPSMYSLHSIHRMKSMRSLIRRKFSRDLAKKPCGDLGQSTDGEEAATSASDTVIKQNKVGHNVQVQVTKDHLRKDLLSDKRRDEGGYDSDAQVLDDIAKNIGKKTPSKRPSIHSIDWTPSTASVANTKKSKFREEFSPSPPKKKLIPSASIIRFFTPKRNSVQSQSEAIMKPGDLLAEMDGSLEVPSAVTQRERRHSNSAVSLEAEQKALGKDKKASPMWERALQNYQDEKAAMLLPKNKELATHTSPFRERSGSGSQHRVSEELSIVKWSVPKRFSAPLLDPPSPSAVEFRDSPLLYTRRTAFLGTDSSALGPDQEAQLRFAQQTDTIDTVGAWGRYPSHSRADRTFSAGHQDQVETRDFALEAAIKFASNGNTDGDDDDEEVDPATRPMTPPLLPGQKKRRKKVGKTRIAKSHSMTFGKSFLRNYTKIFRSQSIEFHRHGQGHRSSIATGGTLEYPELEIIPDVWRRGVIEEASRESSHGDEEACAAHEEYGPGDKKGKGKVKEEDSAATLRPLPTSSRPTTSNLIQAGFDGTKDTARVWSAYYENCLPSFPRASTELDFSAEDFGAPTRRSLESKRASMHSRTMPVRYSKHSRNASRMSHLSRVPCRMIGRPSLESMGENDVGLDERSMVSVRRSTMDLISMYKEQENTEAERVLKIMRTESMDCTALKSL